MTSASLLGLRSKRPSVRRRHRDDRPTAIAHYVGQSLGQSSGEVEHVRMVVSAHGALALDDGPVIEMGAHNSGVAGNEHYVSLYPLRAYHCAAG